MLDREKVVAELVPPAPYRARNIQDERWAQLVREGHVTPSTSHGPWKPRIQPTMKLEDLLKELDDQRADRWST